MKAALTAGVIVLGFCLAHPLMAQSEISAIPKANACQSSYDLFYESEAGVYAYWALCESKKDEIGYDYLGEWPLVHGFEVNNSIAGGVPGPVPDGESAARIAGAQDKLERQDIFLNKYSGTLAAWINADTGNDPVSAESFLAVIGSSKIAITVSKSEAECFAGDFTNSSGHRTVAKDCHYNANTWHRVIVTWNKGTLSLYVDGTLRSVASYSGLLNDSIFYYQLFPGCCMTGKQMALSKVSLANQAWTAAQVERDFAPSLITPPKGGVEVSNDPLGEIHRDVLGYVDTNQDISRSSILSALKKGLRDTGVTSVRYTGGAFADSEDWRGGDSECTKVKGVVAQNQNKSTQNVLDNYITRVAQPLNLSVTFVVNYGSNPPECDAGGDPIANAGDLVRYANLTHHYGIKRWEIGNEQYAYGGGPLIDFHPNKYLASNGRATSTYTDYEPAFYTAMKAVDPSITIAVPALSANAGYNALVNYEMPLLAHAKFDALILHSYPLRDPISDGNTLYPDRVASSTEVRGTLLSFQTQLLNAGKAPDAIWVTEWNAEQDGNKWSKQTLGGAMPLFAAMQLAEYMRAGVPFASWQAQGATDVCSYFNYDPDARDSYSSWDGCGDTALVYTGRLSDAGEQLVGMQPGDLTPAARAFQLLSRSGFVTDGEHMLRTQTDVTEAPWLMAYAATHGSSYAVLLINRDRDLSHTVPVAFADADKGSSVTQWAYGRKQYDGSRDGNWSLDPVTQTFGPWSKTFSARLAPWSVNVLIFSQTTPRLH